MNWIVHEQWIDNKSIVNISNLFIVSAEDSDDTAMPDASSWKWARHVGTWVALLSEELFSPEDRLLSLLALGALSEVSDEGVLLPGGGKHNGTSTWRLNRRAETWFLSLLVWNVRLFSVSLLTRRGQAMQLL